MAGAPLRAHPGVTGFAAAGGDDRARPGVTGFAVAGGESRRMGEDKALLPWGAGTLLDHTLARLGECCPDVRILCGREIRYADRGIPVVPDLVAAAGPLGGVLSGLAAQRGEVGLFLAVDLPSVSVELLRHLLARAEGHQAVVPRSPRGLEPLCAVYRRSCRAAIQRRIERGDLAIRGLVGDVDAVEIAPAELARFGDPEEMFRNLNTREEYEACLKARSESCVGAGPSPRRR
jgi:molybdopterin-guanine dinucleotide biosynthesis protein A